MSFINNQKESNHYDVIINGGGMVGATLACLLAKAGKKVAVIEAAKTKPFDPDGSFDLRVSAISRASQKAFQKINAWDAMLAMRALPYEVMDVWDGSYNEKGDGNVRFDAAELGEPDLGHIIENTVIQNALAETMASFDNISVYQPNKLEGFDVLDVVLNKGVEVTLEDGQSLSADLIVGADGANSKVRSLAGIEVTIDDYSQRGLVATVKTEHHHQYTAWQRFQEMGPLAFLPLADGSCSIVWTLPSDRADYYLSLNKTDFKSALAEAFDYKLGKITKVSDRAAFPLRGSQASPYVLDRVALIGDAAHTIHPLAGQGVNLGIKDALELAQQLEDTNDCGSLKTLRRYERARRGDNVITMRAMEGFRLLFGHSASPVKTVRNFGMNVFNQTPMLKNKVIKRAMGL
ncbi:MAG: 2-octaprenylphenol hydroxylase [Cocleimonas sp.]|jgi:2-octaprenylphenol hydroxylase